VGASKSLKPMLDHWMQANEKPANLTARCNQLQFQPPV
jgi:hypothetical protein